MRNTYQDTPPGPGPGYIIHLVHACLFGVNNYNIMESNVQKDYFKQKVMVIHYQSTAINGKGLWSVRALHNL